MNPISVHIVHAIPLMREGVKSFLKNHQNISRITCSSCMEGLTINLSHNRCDIILLENYTSTRELPEKIEALKFRYPKIKIIALSNDSIQIRPHATSSKLFDGFINYDCEKDVFISTILKCYWGNQYRQLSANIFNENDILFSTHPRNKKSSKAEHLREIVYLLCLGKITKEIADILDLSPRTIEQYRRELNEKVDFGNVVGIIKYGYTSGILDDENLKERFSEQNLTLKFKKAKIQTAI